VFADEDQRPSGSYAGIARRKPAKVGLPDRLIRKHVLGSITGSDERVCKAMGKLIPLVT
jgi:hypothetical protein